MELWIILTNSLSAIISPNHSSHKERNGRILNERLNPSHLKYKYTHLSLPSNFGHSDYFPIPHADL